MKLCVWRMVRQGRGETGRQGGVREMRSVGGEGEEE